MAWTTPSDRAVGYVVTHTVWNENLGASGNTDWLHDYQGASVSKSAQTVASGSFIKVQLNTEASDPNGWFDAVTNFRFLPTHAGTYHISGNVYISAPSTGLCFVALYKNGSATGLYASQVAVGNDVALSVAFDLSLNGSTDYIELFVQHNHGTDRTVNGFMSAHFVGA